MNWYAGIGSRKITYRARDQLRGIGAWMAERGWGLRTGGADGADESFLYGAEHVGGEVELFLPWQGFNHHKSQFCHVSQAAMEIAAAHHPKWDTLKQQSVRKLHGRNSRQVLGPNLDNPSSCIVCWTGGGRGRGGTGQALRIAQHYEIPIFDFGRPDQEDVWIELQVFVHKVEREQKTSA